MQPLPEGHPANVRTSLPTRRLILTSCAGGLGTGDIWALGALSFGFGRFEAIAGLLAGAAAAAAGVGSVAVIGSWKSRPIASWGFVFLAATLAQMVFSLALGLLLYFRTPFGSVAGWLCLVVACWMVLFGNVSVFASHMRRFSPDHVGQSSSETANRE